MDREKVINCLTDIENIMIVRQDICPREELQYWIELQEGVADALALLKEQEHKDKMFHTLEDDWKRLKELLKEQQKEKERSPVIVCPHCGKRIK